MSDYTDEDVELVAIHQTVTTWWGRYHAGYIADGCAVIDLTECLMAALSALPRQTVQDWMPIETAPKDGTEILAGFFGKPSGAFYVDLVQWHRDDEAFYARSGLKSYATLYLIPAPPQQDKP